MRRFDKKREGRKTSNDDWVNPHDPDAKVGMAKHGACDMIYKPEQVTDLGSETLVAATVRPGNDRETKGLAAGQPLFRACLDPRQAKGLQSLTADEGYFSVEDICALQGERIRTVIGEPHAATRRKDKQDGTVRQGSSPKPAVP